MVDFPNILSIVDEIDRPRMTVVAMAFTTQVHSVSLYFAGPTKPRTLPVRLLSEKKVRKVHLEPFRYGTFAFAGRSCINRFIARSKSGAVVDDGGPMRCHVHRGDRKLPSVDLGYHVEDYFP